VSGLRSTQRRFLDLVRAPSALPRRARPGDRAEARALVLPSPTRAPEEGVAIYGRMYAARLRECLAADFPVVLRLVGEERFTRLARRYVTARPPSSWTLNHLGLAFPAFLDGERALPRPALVRDVARLERAMSEAFDAEEAPPLTPEGLARTAPEAFVGLRLAPAPSLRLCALGTAANRVVTAVREGRAPPPRLPRGETFVAVYRKEHRVYRLDLTRPMHAALRALARGLSLGAALTAAARAFEGDPARLPEFVRGWFALWVAEGLFRA